ncbi:ABC transporter substrate-binding protein [Breoghania sp.]|uniref:ABC transporter substrate-binding protein n=1 Tax=Breoghania sp. TaxID=2065378 RepID=UPI0029C9F5D6|nr:ABC transporter substrate-binding protein [Breoghania sp.]
MAINSRSGSVASLVAVLAGALFMAQPAAAEQRVIKISGFGAESGVLSSFGTNSEAAMRAASTLINRAGGVRLADGTRARIEIEYRDDGCDVERGLATLADYVKSDSLVVVGTTCSSVLKPVFESLQKKAGDASDDGFQIPIFADVAMRKGLAGISDWAFRNIPDEVQLYESLWDWMKEQDATLKTVYAGVEENQVHANLTWNKIIKISGAAAGYEVVGDDTWFVDTVDFTKEVEKMRAVNADVVVISAHPFTGCGVLREMARQDYRPKAVIGLTSLATPELIEKCGAEADGMVVPTSFAPINEQARAAAEATAQFNGYADLHSMAAWENIYAIKQVIESEGVQGLPETVAQDRERIRVGLQKLRTMNGLLGEIDRTDEGESVKSYVFVEAHPDGWQVVYDSGS